MHNEHFIERMELGKVLAKEDREQYGSSTVKVVSTTTAANYRGKTELDNFDLWLLQVQDRVADAREDGLRLIYPERYESFTDIPF